MRPLVLILVWLIWVEAESRGEDLPWTASELKQARKLYLLKCAKCHKLYEPSSYSDAEWKGWMKKMIVKSKLRPPQAELVNRYADELRARKDPGHPK